MRIEPLLPDVAAAPAPRADGQSFAKLLDGVSAQLERADTTERAYTNGAGNLQEMVLDRARADIMLQVAATGAQRVAQGITTLFGMQI